MSAPNTTLSELLRLSPEQLLSLHTTVERAAKMRNIVIPGVCTSGGQSESKELTKTTVAKLFAEQYRKQFPGNYVSTDHVLNTPTFKVDKIIPFVQHFECCFTVGVDHQARSILRNVFSFSVRFNQITGRDMLGRTLAYTFSNAPDFISQSYPYDSLLSGTVEDKQRYLVLCGLAAGISFR
jgi:hypothetical protein